MVFARFLICFLLLFPLLPAWGAGGKTVLSQAPIDYNDIESVQRGAAAFANYCQGCHSVKYMRYGRLAEDLKISGGQIEDFLIHNEAGLADEMVSAMTKEEGKEWFWQASPPDLSLVARLRGVDWLYAYLRGFYRDYSRPSGWNNAVFENAAMPHVLSHLQGIYERTSDGTVKQIRPGKMSVVAYDAMIADVVGFLAYAGEPTRAQRIKTGYLVMAFLLLFLLIVYFLYREYWKDIH
ncbi:cytochrome c1 [Candidatus Persebacteraceae bacterium Df01]|jgi:ubiquinol-cytochrome c reductase cytochrome c1 subunit|uniref:Cytochrome c1 n=1 Tax=Candidatus Doriopsillibacter californiensis TaxID=2970740 RepID=A0ABT7QJE4_9GAMM|nr:cytochrome c1 [Candidatus Persebacteraceae bacterium Df01]